MAALIPHYVDHIQEETKKAGSTQAALKYELTKLTVLTIETRALLNCVDPLARNFSGPQKGFDIVNVSTKGRSAACDSPQAGFDMVDEAIVISKYAFRP